MKRILVVEDDPTIRANVLELLDAEGFVAEGAENGRRGVEAARATLPDLVLCDIAMPELDGFGVLAALRAHPETAGVPFVFLTAKADRSDIRAGMNLGADDYLTKPFSRVELLEAIRARLRRQEATDTGSKVRLAEAALQAMETIASRTSIPAEAIASEGRTLSPPPGALIDGKIEIVRTLGTGGMGTVFEGRHTRTGRRVAIKLLRPSRLASLEAIRRFQQEALTCGRIEHPNVVEVLDAGTHEGAPYLVMELLLGESLEARVAAGGALSVPDAVQVVRQALAGVGAAHRLGIVHRDLKPDNLFLHQPPSGAPIVKVVDFGASKLAAVDDPGLTRTGMVLGTPHYMSPEQAMGSKEVDLRADLYALGGVLFFALTGALPVEADNYNAIMNAILTLDPPSARALRPEVPVALDAVLRRAMSRARELRYATAEAFGEALVDAITGS